jgi:hypothetical protein
VVGVLQGPEIGRRGKGMGKNENLGRFETEKPGKKYATGKRSLPAHPVVVRKQTILAPSPIPYTHNPSIPTPENTPTVR